MDMLAEIRASKIIAIFRGVPLDKAVRAANSLCGGGIRMLEVAFGHGGEDDIGKTCATIEAIKHELGDILEVGAGTVLSADEARAAYNAGAGFILAPDTNEEVIKCAKSLGMGAIPGAYTPTEITRAYSLGADAVKLFPVSLDGGVDYLKAIRAPLSHIPLLSVGGVNLENMRSFLKLSDGVGIGSSLVKASLIKDEKFAELEALAAAYVREAETK